MQKEKEVVEDEMVREHYQLNGHEYEQTSGNSGEQRSLTCSSPRGCRVRHDLVAEQQQNGNNGIMAFSEY